MKSKKAKTIEESIFHMSEAKECVDRLMKTASIQDKAKLAAVQYYLKESAFYMVNILNNKDKCEDHD